MLASGRPDVIYSSAPPWSVQVVAWILARASGRPWVADFRDPWARAPGREWRQPFRQRAAAMLERAVVLRAQAVLFVTRANLAEFSDVHGAAQARRFHLVPNGCDPSEFDRGTGRPAATPFVLLHAGSFYGPRNPLAIIHALARVIDRRLLDRKEFRLRLLGTVSLSTDLSEECRRLGVADVVEVVPRVSRAESLQALQAASALLLVQTGTTMSIPGKAYEYLAAGRPILALSEEGETAELVRSSGIGVSVSPGDPPEKIDAALLRIASIARASYAPPDVRLYDGRIQAAETARILLRFVPDTRHLPGGTDSMLLGETPPAPGEETGR
jgi:glycosyltransferase involved in cell wall biosynthesis